MIRLLQKIIESNRLINFLNIIGFALITSIIIWWVRRPVMAYEGALWSFDPLSHLLLAAVLLYASLLTLCGVGRLPAVLGTLAALCFVSEPVIRGFFFQGADDPSSHLAWVKLIMWGEMDATSLAYPASHTLAAISAFIFGIRPELAVMNIVVVFSLVFIFGAVVVSMSIKAGLWRPALVLAWSFPHVNHLDTHLLFQATSLATFLFPWLLWALLRGGARFTPLFAVFSIAMVFYHPLHGLTIAFALAVGAVFSLAATRTKVNAIYNPIYSAFIGFLAILQMINEKRIVTGAAKAIGGAAHYLNGATNVVQSNGNSLEAVGTGFEVLGLRLFSLPSFILAASAAAILTRFRRWPHTIRGKLYVLSGVLVAALAMTVMGVLVSATYIGFRFLGFAIIAAIPLASIALSYAHPIRHISRSGVTISLFSLSLILITSIMVSYGAATVQSSPWFLTDSGHVTLAQSEGYKAAFAHGSLDQTYGVRRDAIRYAHINLEPDAVGINPQVAGGLDFSRHSIHTLVIFRQNQTLPPGLIIGESSADRYIEGQLYNNVFWRTSDDESLDTNGSLWYDNGDLELTILNKPMSLAAWRLR